MMANKGGRTGPVSKYTPELLEAAWDYVENYEKNHDHVVPTISGMAPILGVRRETLHVWANETDKEDLKYLMDALMDLQETVLVNGGLRGTFTSVITKLMLAKHGYHDKQDTNLGGSLTVNIGDKDAGTL